MESRNFFVGQVCCVFACLHPSRFACRTLLEPSPEHPSGSVLLSWFGDCNCACQVSDISVDMAANNLCTVPRPEGKDIGTI